MSDKINSFITSNIQKIALAIGFDTSDVDSDSILTAFVESGVDDMRGAGVSEHVIINNKLSLITLCLYVKDNISLESGKTTASPIYTANVQKLKLISLTTTEEVGL